jgi:hypothetical protein
MAYMAQQWVADAARDAFRDRFDALERAAEAATMRAWLASLSLDGRVLAALDEPIAALEEGMREAARSQAVSRPPSDPHLGDAPDPA